MVLTSRLASLFLLAICSARVAAQEVTGSARGRVVADDGTPVAAVALTLTGPQMQGARTTVSDIHGYFQFRSLPPGTYELRAAHIGHRPLVVRDVPVVLGRTTGLGDLTLAASPVFLEPLVVTAAPVALDPVSTAAGGTLDAADYAALPVDRDWTDLIPLLPQVNASHRGDLPNSAGSTGLENVYFIDGVNVSDARMANRATALPYNFVRAVEVKTAGYEAQYGRAMGAAVNAVTYSGTNDFEVSGFAFVEPHALVYPARPLPGVVQGESDRYDIGVRVSGPLRRDRLWFSAALNPRWEVLDKEIVGFGPATERAAAVLFATKLTWRPFDAGQVELSVFGDPGKRDEVSDLPDGIAAVANPDPLLTRREFGGTVASLRAAFSPSTQVLIEAAVARQWDRATVAPRTDLGRTEPFFVDDLTATLAGGPGFTLTDKRGRTSLMARVTWSLASHTVGAGIELDDGHVTTAYEDIGLGTVGRIDTSRYVVVRRAYAGTFHNRSPAAYLQDSWRLGPRLTLTAGLRWSGQFLVGASGRTAQRITDEWQPRAGFSWLLDRTERHRVFGSYGRYYQLLPSNLSTGWFVDYYFTETYYDADPRVPGANVVGFRDLTTYEEDYAVQVPGLEAENLDEFTLGYERLVGQRGRLTLRAVRRDLRSAFLSGYDPDGPEIWAFGTPGTPQFPWLPPPVREYTALEVSGEGVWRALRYRASYVLSWLWGNYSGFYTTDLGFGSPGGNAAFLSPNQAANSTGYLASDRRHVFKLSGDWSPTARVNVGGFLAVESGSPINAFVEGPWGAGPTFLVPRGSVGRTPWLWNLDLRLAYAIPVRGQGRMRLLADVLRLGNPRGTTRVDEWRYLSVDLDGNPTLPNARYGLPSGYQASMAVRVGVEAGF